MSGRVPGSVDDLEIEDGVAVTDGCDRAWGRNLGDVGSPGVCSCRSRSAENRRQASLVVGMEVGDDHVPHIVDDSPWGHRSRAYAIGYIKAMLDVVNKLY